MQTIGGETICTCIGCGKPLDVYVNNDKLIATCKNKQCRRLDITLEATRLQSLSNANLDEIGYPDYSKNVRPETNERAFG
jgi:hypothetical protein